MSGLFKNLQPYNPSWKNHGTGGGTSFTLDVPSTTNATLLTIGGVLQLAGTDYTVSGTTVTTTSSVASGVEVISAVLYDLGSVTTPGAGTVNFDALSFTSQAQGDILYRDSSTWARLPAGTSGQFLKTQGTGANPTWGTVSGGGFEFVSSTNASGASVEFESLSGNYDYRLQFRNVTCAADTQMIMQFGTGGTPTYATANYQTQYAVFEQSAAGYAGNDGSGQAHITLGNSMNGSTPRNGYVEIYDLANSSVFTSLWGIMIAEQNGGVETMNIFGGYLETAQADNSIKLDETAGTTFNGGSIALFRRPNA